MTDATPVDPISPGRMRPVAMELRIATLDDLVRKVEVPGLTFGRNPGADQLIEQGEETAWLLVDEPSGEWVSGRDWNQHFTSRQTEILIHEAILALRERRAAVLRGSGIRAEMQVLVARLDVGRAVVVFAARSAGLATPPLADESAILMQLTQSLTACLVHGENLFQELRTRVEHRAAEHEMLRQERGEIFIGTVTEREERIRQQRERELWEKLCREAESANRAKTEFLSNISHELRTPLTAILGYADMLSEEADPQQREQYIETIRRQGQNLLALVNDILELSILDSGNAALEMQECRPWEVAEEALEWLRSQTEWRGLAVRTECVFPMPTLISTDPRRLRQILLHLLSNAIKFTERGEVVLGVRWVKVARGKSQIQFSVQDTGPGIDPDTLAQLFQPFHQLDNTSTRRHGGLGLGLTIVQRLIHALAGTLEVSSCPGQGSKFTVCLDAELLPGVELAYGLPRPPSVSVSADSAGRKKTDRGAQEDRNSRQPGSAGHRDEPPDRPQESVQHGQKPSLGRILLVEDAPENRRLIGHFLQQEGWEVETAENGLDGWRAAIRSVDQNRPFDLILMDMQMPVMDGYDACARLRQAGWRGPIVALTAHALPEDREKCLKAGCDDYLSKPIRREVLVQAVRKQLSSEPAYAPI